MLYIKNKTGFSDGTAYVIVSGNVITAVSAKGVTTTTERTMQDVATAIARGSWVEITKEEALSMVHEPAPGDVYDAGQYYVSVLSAGYKTGKVYLGGLGSTLGKDNLFNPYSNPPMTIDEMRAYLGERSYKFVFNMNEKVPAHPSK